MDIFQTPPLSALDSRSYVALSAVSRHHEGQWLPLGEEVFLDAQTGSVLRLQQPLSARPTPAIVGALRPGSYQLNGRQLSREQLVDELRAAPVAFRALVEPAGGINQWLIRLQD